MLELNKVLLIGNLTRDPELSYIASGQALAKMGLACNRSYKDKNGQRQEEATFVDIDAWGQTAEFCGKYLKKGRRIFVEGRLQYNAWEASDGTKRSQIRITAERVQFADSRPAEEGQGGGYAGGDRPAAAPRPSAPAGPPPPRPAAPAQSAPFPESSPPGDAGQDNTNDDLPF